jgi:hypothetical protein
MACYLLTVESAQARGDTLKVLPRVPINAMIAREPDLMTPMPGAPLQLRLPDGGVRVAAIKTFGVEAWERDGSLFTTSPPDNPELTLVIAGGLRPADVPAGTEIWLAEPSYRPTSTGS